MKWASLFGFFGKGRSKMRRPRRPALIKATLRVEPLEDRILLAWQAIMRPQINGQANVAGNFTNPAEPVTGRVTSLAFGRNNAGQPALFLGADGGGVFESVVDNSFTANTPTWSARTDFGIVDPQKGVGTGYANINCITVDPNNLKIIYAGTGHPYDNDMHGSGILTSYDGGNTFEALRVDRGPLVNANGAPDPNGMPAFFQRDISQIIVDPRTGIPGLGGSTTMYAAVTSPLTNPDGTPNDDANRGIYKLQAGGWVRMTGTGLNPIAGDNHIGPGAFVTDLAYTQPAAGRLTLYAGVLSTNSPAMGGIWRSDDGGATWQHQVSEPALPPGIQSIKFAYDPNQAVGNQTVYAAMTGDNGNLRSVMQWYSGCSRWISIPLPGSFRMGTSAGPALTKALLLLLLPTGSLRSNHMNDASSRCYSSPNAASTTIA